MISASTIAVVDLVLGSVAAVGLLYLLYSETVVVHYHRFFRLVTLGLLVYAVTGPVVGVLAPAYIHAIHGAAALFISIGLYDVVRDDLDNEPDLTALLDVDDPGDVEFGFREDD